MAPSLYPLLLKPSLHKKVWGGRKLETVLHKSLPTNEPYGESWELHDSATVANGALAGRTLGDVLSEYGIKLIGKGNNPAEGFPLLGKFIDANDWLSIQVHPNDEQAAALESQPRGKAEAWVCLEADEGSQMVIGMKPGTTRETMTQAIRDGVLEQHIVYADAKRGDVLFLEANTVHALGPGLLIYEIQQSSDTTYRLYDWNRIGLDGKPRELHIEKGVQVSNMELLPLITHPWDESTLVQCPYFQTDLHRLSDETVELETGSKFHALTCINGHITAASGSTQIELTTGRSGLIPAALDAFTIQGDGAILRSWQPA